MFRSTLPAALLLSMTFVPAAYAAGPDDASDTPVCETGMVYDDNQEKCVTASEQSFNDDGLMNNAKALAYAGRYSEAMALLEQVKDTQDSEVQTYLGYVSRNLGDLEGGLAYYRTAITLNPDDTLARSYMGQALLLSGDRRAALVQLDEIAARDGTGGRAYTELAQALLAKSLDAQTSY